MSKFQENLLEIRKNANTKRVEKMFRKFFHPCFKYGKYCGDLSIPSNLPRYRYYRIGIDTFAITTREIWVQTLVNTCPHVSTNTTSFLRKFFNEHLISTNLWPPRRPDLSPLDFFLSGYLKNCVYMTPPRNLEEPKSNIARHVENINQKTLKHVFLNLMNQC